MISDTKTNWSAGVGETLDSEQVATMQQICMCAKELPFSKILVPLLDENYIYVNQMIISKTFSRIDIKKMITNLWDDIEYKRATEDTKHEDTCIIGLFYFISNVSIRDYL